MAKPYIHAQSSARRHGGEPEDYADIHDFMDCSKSSFSDNRHRALTHNAWFVGVVIERVFGRTRINSAGKEYSTRQIAEEHVLEDYQGRYIPTAADFLAEMEFRSWMDNGRKSFPPSHAKLAEREANVIVRHID
jgi:hypothetical protein